jgi:urease accessory protein
VALALSTPKLHNNTLGEHRNWKASLDITFGVSKTQTKTQMQTLDFFGPLRVQKPFYPEGDPCHVYILHPPGGCVSGDELSINVTAKPYSHVVLTSPSAAKFYKVDSCGVTQTIRTELTLKHATIEWLPQETIFFPNTNAHSVLTVHLDEQSTFLGWEFNSIGCPASGYDFTQGNISQDIQIKKDGKWLLIDRFRLQGESNAMSSMAVLQGNSVMATLIGYGFEQKPENLINELRELVASNDQICCGITWKNDLLIIRAMADEVEICRNVFIAMWQRIRPVLCARPAELPRIWAT